VKMCDGPRSGGRMNISMNVILQDLEEQIIYRIPNFD
jgi:hypothetical protein